MSTQFRTRSTKNTWSLVPKRSRMKTATQKIQLTTFTNEIVGSCRFMNASLYQLKQLKVYRRLCATAVILRLIPWWWCSSWPYQLFLYCSLCPPAEHKMATSYYGGNNEVLESSWRRCLKGSRLEKSGRAWKNHPYSFFGIVNVTLNLASKRKGFYNIVLYFSVAIFFKIPTFVMWIQIKRFFYTFFSKKEMRGCLHH